MSQPLTSESKDTLIYIVSGVISAILVVILILLLAAIYRSSWSKHVKRSNSSQLYVKDCESSAGGTLVKNQMVNVSTLASTSTTTTSTSHWKDTDSTRKSPIPSISDNLSWRYNVDSMPSSGGKVAMPQTKSHNSSSTDSSMYSNDS